MVRPERTADRSVVGQPAPTWSAAGRTVATSTGLKLPELRRLVFYAPPKVLLVGTFYKIKTCLKLFISHAKMDGLPLARSLKHQISEIKWLSKFYDADDIPTGSNWKTVLQQAAGSCLMVMLRTEFYDGRPWCQQEVIWADEYAVPAVLVDARVNLNHPGANLPFDRVPAVRIPDGNLLRILFLALREGLRYLLFLHQVGELKRERLPKNAELRAFSFAPGMPALLRACKDLTKFGGVPKFILYPDPALRAPLLEVAEALIDKYAPGTILATPKNLAAMGVTP
jgi:hypothetical protein